MTRYRMRAAQKWAVSLRAVMYFVHVTAVRPIWNRLPDGGISVDSAFARHGDRLRGTERGRGTAVLGSTNAGDPREGSRRGESSDDVRTPFPYGPDADCDERREPKAEDGDSDHDGQCCPRPQTERGDSRRRPRDDRIEYGDDSWDGHEALNLRSDPRNREGRPEDSLVVVVPARHEVRLQ